MEGDLAHMLEGLPEGPRWQVDRVLKESPSEVTQVVRLRTETGELGPFVRKVMVCGPGVGEVWERLYECQRQGLRSRQLPRLLACQECDGSLEVVMDLVPGPTLRRRVETTPPGERERLAARVIPSLCDAATELNESMGVPVVHRDITPSNVICSGLDGNCAVLVDLGIARTWHEGQPVDTTHFGTRAYAPPEQFGFGQTDLRCDVYALGMCAFFCLTGRDPSPRDREVGFDVEGVPAAWREVIARAGAFDPSERYSSAREMGEALRETVSAPMGDRARLPEQAAPSRRQARVREALLWVWRSRNVLVVPVIVILLVSSVANVFDPKAMSRGNPRLNAFGYLVYMNYCILAVGYVAMDKRWLRAHVAYLRTHSTAQVIRLLVGIFAALTTVLAVLAAIFR